MSKKLIILILVFVTLLSGIGAIYIGTRLSQQPVTPTQTGAAPAGAIETNWKCSGACDSGRECNKNPNCTAAGCNKTEDPEPGTVWSCYSNGSEYKCYMTSPIDACTYGCEGSEQPCNCDEDKCEKDCLDTIGPGESGDYTMECTDCKQDFTCSCSKPVITTPPVVLNCADKGCMSDSDCQRPGSTGYWNNDPITYGTCDEVIGNNPADQQCQSLCPTGYTLDPPCNCVLDVTNPPPTTEVPPPSITVPPPTGGISITPLPTSALISDEADRILLGMLSILIGIFLFKSGLYFEFIKLIKYSPLFPNAIDKEVFEEEILKETE